MLCLLAVAAAFAIWLTMRGENGLPVLDAPERSATAGPEHASPAEATASPVESDVTRSPAETPQASSEPTLAGGDTKVLVGTFVVVDPRGVEHPHEDGEFSLVLWQGNSGHHARVIVKAGRWQHVVATLPAKVSVDDARLGDRIVRCDEELPVGDEITPLAFRGHWFAALRLRVLADETGADLAAVRLVTNSAWRSPFPHPGNDEIRVVVERGNSPLQFEPTSTGDTQTVWAHAEGRAWDHVKLDTTSAAERVLRLLPGGDVDVTIVGGSFPRDTRLRVREPLTRPANMTEEAWQIMRTRSQGTPIAELMPKAAAMTRIEGLRVGTWSIVLEQGDWFGEPVTLASATVEIIAGTVTPVTLTLAGDRTAPPNVRVAGMLVVGEAWGTQLALSIEAKGSTKAWYRGQSMLGLKDMKRTGANEYAWDAGMLPAGEYQVLVDGTEYRTRFSLPPQGNENVRIVVPDPCEVQLRVIDAETGRAIGGDWTPGWYSTPAEWEGGWGHAMTTARPDGSFHFLAPPGPITVHAHPGGYLWSQEHYDVQRGVNSFVLQIRRASGVDIVLVDGESTLPWPDSLQALLTDADGKSVVAYWSDSRIAVKEPGEFTLQVDEVAGYEPIEPRKVVVSAQEWTKITIPLRRKQ